MDKQTGPKGFLVVLPGEIIEIPQDSDKSWLTLFYSLPRELAEKWHHNRSGKPISLDEMMENEDGDIFEVADPRGEFEQKVISEMRITAFAERSISEKDREILKLRMDGLTEQEIADKVGCKTASAVHKRIAKNCRSLWGLCDSGVSEVFGQVNRPTIPISKSG